MDARNTFETKNTFLLWRMENAVLLLVTVVLMAMHYDEIRWLPFIILFSYIDLIGYIPGAIVYRLKNGKVPKVFYVLYNFTHNYITAGIVALAWAVLVEFEWALLAIPFHLLGDRAVFGNSYKNFHVCFEGKSHQGFATFSSSLKSSKEADL